MQRVSSGRRRRLAEELQESGLRFEGSEATLDMLIDEVDLALRPPVHERRVPTSGTILDPTNDSRAWAEGAELGINRKPVGAQPLKGARRFADGLSCWLLRWSDGRGAEWLIFDRPAGSERDLVVLAKVLGATLVQRHPANQVRVAGPFGVLRWNGFSWHHEPLVSSWIDLVAGCALHGDAEILQETLRFAVHDLGSLGIGALLVHRPGTEPGPAVEERLPVPPPLRIGRPVHLAPLRHALSQVDGAAFFDGGGVLRRLGVRLVPSSRAEADVEPFRGTRHTSARRYSYDDPLATVVAVSEDGPVTVFRNGRVIGRSPDDEVSPVDLSVTDPGPGLGG